jgi:hypothetical protein
LDLFQIVHPVEAVRCSPARGEFSRRLLLTENGARWLLIDSEWR